jgi:AcrR family transcriptional regulator
MSAKTQRASPLRPFRDRLRRELLAVAERIVETEGLEALQARRLALESKASVGTIYNVFGDLDGLILAANETTLDLLSTPLSEAARATEQRPLLDRLMALALAYQSFAYHHLPRWRAVFEYRLPANRELPPAYAAKRAQLLALIEKAIEGEVPENEARGHAARALFAAVHGIIALALDNKLAPFDPRSVEAEIRFIVTAAARGLGATRRGA